MTVILSEGGTPESKDPYAADPATLLRGVSETKGELAAKLPDTATVVQP
jgi:hypothetical protein